MLTFKVTDMNCGHCVSAITQALQAAKPQATVEIDLPSKTVRITGADNPDEVGHIISEAGFTPTLLGQ
jgi:copper chaperone